MMSQLPTVQGIYLITNKANQYGYIGSAVNIRARCTVHISMLKSNQHHNPRLQNAFNKYGESQFVFSVLDILPDGDDLIALEQRWLDGFDVANNHDFYNFCPIAHSTRGRVVSSETRQRIASSLKGMRVSPETRAKMSQTRKGRRNASKLTDDQVREIRAARPLTPYAELSRIYHVSIQNLSRVVNRHSYKDVF